MKPLFDLSILNSPDYYSLELMPLACELCGNVFTVMAKFIKSNIKLGRNEHQFCTKACQNISQTTIMTGACGQCAKPITVLPNVKKASKSGKNFCNTSCAARYNNTHKTAGTRRSKLEKWVEEQLRLIYPTLGILFNQKEAINSELDIHIPSLSLAIELNGIFHYQPIYGKDKLASTQNNDDRKFQVCLEKHIELVIIDISGQKHFKATTSQKYLDIIRGIIDMKLSTIENKALPF